MKHNNFYTPTVIQNRKPKKWTPIQGGDINQYRLVVLIHGTRIPEGESVITVTT